MSGAKDAKRIFPLNRRIGTTPQPEGWTTSENDSQAERGRRLSRLAALGLSGPPLSGRSYNLVQNAGCKSLVGDGVLAFADDRLEPTFDFYPQAFGSLPLPHLVENVA